MMLLVSLQITLLSGYHALNTFLMLRSARTVDNFYEITILFSAPSEPVVVGAINLLRVFCDNQVP